jgi:predicted membrane protein
MTKHVFATLVALAFVPTQESYAASIITFTVPGSVGTGVAGINRSSTVIGSYWRANGVDHGFVRTASGAITTFDAPGSTGGTLANAINVYGAITGNFLDANETQHGFLRATDGSIETFDAPGAGTGYNEGTYAVSINPSNTVLGYSIPNDGTIDNSQGYLRNADGSFVPIMIPASRATLPSDLNDAGVVTGSYADALNTFHGFLWSVTGLSTTFDVPGSNYTYPSAINEGGTIAGSTIIGSKPEVFIRDVAGTFTTFEVPGAGYLTVTGINESGEVSGFATGPHINFNWGFVRSASGFLAVFTLSQQNTSVTGLNNQGIFAGTVGPYPGEVGYLRQP